MLDSLLHKHLFDSESPLILTEAHIWLNELKNFEFAICGKENNHFQVNPL